MSAETDTDDGSTDYDDGTIPFAGLTRWSDADQSIIPDVWGHDSSMRWWAADQRGEENPTELPGTGLNPVVQDLPRASTADVYIENPATGTTMKTGKHNAIIEPSRMEQVEWGYGTRVEAALDLYGEKIGVSADGLREMSEEHQSGLRGALSEFLTSAEAEEIMDLTVGDDALFYVPTDDYEIINPAQALNPLSEVIREEELQDDVFGEFRLSRGGGRVSADILFDGKHVQHPDLDGDRKPICVGFEVNYDFFGDVAFRARGLGMDFECVNALRALTDWEIVKHAGDIESRVDWKEWWRSLLEAIDLKVDQLSQAIQAADEMELDFGDLPQDFAADHDNMLEAFYDYAGLPGYLADAAASNARAEAQDPFAPTWWELHRGATWAITHRARGEVMGGGSIDAYHRVADDMLFNPEVFEDRVMTAYRDAQEDEQSSISAEGGGEARISQAFDTVRERKDEYEQRRGQIKNLIEDEREAEAEEAA